MAFQWSNSESDKMLEGLRHSPCRCQFLNHYLKNSLQRPTRPSLLGPRDSSSFSISLNPPRLAVLEIEMTPLDLSSFLKTDEQFRVLMNEFGSGPCLASLLCTALIRHIEQWCQWRFTYTHSCCKHCDNVESWLIGELMWFCVSA